MDVERGRTSIDYCTENISLFYNISILTLLRVLAKKCVPFLLAIDGYFLCRYVPSSIKAIGNSIIFLKVKCEEMNMVYTVKKSLKWTFTCM
jgi:hypothetical protein